MAEREDRWLPLYEESPRDWASHPRKWMLMTPWLIVVGGLFAYAIPTLVGAFFHLLFFHPPISHDWAPLATDAKAAGITGDAVRGRQIFVANGCIYCHSGYSRPQDTREGLFYLYPRVSLPGDFATTDESPNVFGTARIGPDLSQEGGFHPDDWHRAHYSDPRYVDPDSLMPRFNFLSTQEVEDLIAYVQLRSGKSGLVRYAGQLYMKQLFLKAANLKPPPIGFAGDKKTFADVAREATNAPDPPPGDVDGLGWPDPINLNHVDRGYWLTGNPMPVTTDNLLRGRVIFQERCIGCHGRGGAAVSKAAGFMMPTPIDFTGPDDAVAGLDTSPGDYYYRVLRGINGTAMENFGTRLRVDDIWKVVLFLKTIPNGGLEPNRIPTPDIYIQWKPPPDLMSYVSKHPIDQNKDYTEFDAAQTEALGSDPSTATAQEKATQVDTSDPFMAEARRDLAGLNDADRFTLPGYGEISLAQAAKDIKAIYERILNEGYASYQQRGGEPAPPPGQREKLPDPLDQLR